MGVGVGAGVGVGVGRGRNWRTVRTAASVGELVFAEFEDLDGGESALAASLVDMVGLPQPGGASPAR